MFFPACTRRFGLGRPALLDEGRDEAAEGGMLSSALQVLQKVRAATMTVTVRGAGYNIPMR